MGATDALIPYSFQDLHAKFTKDFGGFGRLSVTGYVNSESFDNLEEEFNETATFGWGNAAVAAHYRDGLGANTLIDVTLGHSRFSSHAEPEPLTLGTLFDIYGEEVIPTKGKRSRLQNRAAMKMFLGCFGRDRRPETLSQRDWDRFILARRVGRVGPSGKPVADRTIEHDLTFLMTVLNWATRSRDEHGRLLLDRNPLKGLKKPKAKNPNRVVLAHEE